MEIYSQDTIIAEPPRKEQGADPMNTKDDKKGRSNITGGNERGEFAYRGK